MDNNKAREILIKHNRWRRGDMDIVPHNAIQLGQAIDCAIQALGDGWVSVDDGLPECDGNYLVLLNGGNIIEQLTTSYFRAEYKSFDASFTTHWQPLPPKPKQP
jgi:hypothetical protein